MLFACDEHLEQAIDRFVNETEQPPEVLFIEKVDLTKEQLAGCAFCSEAPRYVLARFGEVRERD